MSTGTGPGERFSGPGRPGAPPAPLLPRRSVPPKPSHVVQMPEGKRIHVPHVAMVNVLVRDYDEAIAFFTGAFGLDLLEDTPQDGGKRWVVVGSRSAGAGLRLALATSESQLARVGNQSGTSVGFFLHVEDFDATLRRALTHGAVACEEPRDEPHGRVIILADLYGNRWDVIEPTSAQ